MKHYILDTYNITNLIRQADSNNRAIYFLVTLIRYFSLKHPTYSISMVFDGFATQEFMLPPNVFVVNSGYDTKADEIIKDMIDFEQAKASCTVVSSDLEVYSYARISSCKPMKSDDFLDILQKNYISMTGEKQGKPDKPVTTTAAEKKNLMNEFSKELEDKSFMEEYKAKNINKEKQAFSYIDFTKEPPMQGKKKKAKSQVFDLTDKSFSMTKEEMDELLKLFGGDK
jgi:hypothetical protein